MLPSIVAALLAKHLISLILPWMGILKRKCLGHFSSQNARWA